MSKNVSAVLGSAKKIDTRDLSDEKGMAVEQIANACHLGQCWLNPCIPSPPAWQSRGSKCQSQRSLRCPQSLSPLQSRGLQGLPLPHWSPDAQGPFLADTAVSVASIHDGCCLSRVCSAGPLTA